MARLLLASVLDAVGYLRDQLKRIIPACLKERQRSRMTTLECLEAQCNPVLDIEVPVMKKHAA